MHIPDGFVSGSINSLGALAALGAVGVSAWLASREMQRQPHTMPLVATTGAFVFAAQMLNFPIGMGTSGHFLGAAAVAALLGPWRACLVMTLVLLLQSLLFSDGGLTALGTNIVNMAVVAGIGSYLVMRTLRALLPAGRSGYLVSAAVASWISVVLAATACAVELALSGTSPLLIVLPAMVGTHVVIGVGEALITTAMLSAVIAARPDLVPSWATLNPATCGMAGELAGAGAGQSGRRAWGLAALGLAFALFLAAFISPFASTAPDGLEHVAEQQQFLERAEGQQVWQGAVLPDYTVPAVENEEVSTGAAGLVGTTAMFLVGFVVVRILSMRSMKRES